MNLLSSKNWKMAPLSQVIDLVLDHRGKTPKKLGSDWVKEGYRALSAKNIHSGELVNQDQIRFVDNDLYNRWMTVEIQRGDILLTSEGPLGEYLYWDSVEKIVLSQRLFGIRLNRNKVLPKFYYYLLGTPYYRNELFGRATGTTVAGIRQSELLKTMLIFPESLTEQKQIADLLGSFDDKIELLRKQNETLEAMAQALFKEWFVDFRFPGSTGKMVESALGMIPEGWSIGKIEDLTSKINSGGTPSTKREEFYNGSIKWFSTKELQDGFIFKSEKSITPIGLERSSAKLFPVNTVIMAIYAAPTVGRLGILGAEAAFNQAAVGLVADEKKVGYEFIYLLLKHLRGSFNGLANGAAQQNLNVGLVKNYRIAIPSNGVAMKFKGSTKNIFLLIRNNSEQIVTLSKMRDELLNKIFSE